MTGVIRICRLLLLGLFLAQLAACGFHLRGNTVDTPNRLTALTLKGDNRYDNIAADIQQLAHQYGVATDSNDALWSLTIVDEDLQQQRISATQSVTNDEFLLKLTVHYRLEYQGQPLEPQSLSREMLFQDDQDTSASKDNEQQLIVQELRQQLAEQLWRQIQIIAANPPECNDEAESPAAR